MRRRMTDAVTSERLADLLRGIRPYTVPADMQAVTNAARAAMSGHSEVEAAYQAILAAVRKRAELFGGLTRRPYDI